MYEKLTDDRIAYYSEYDEYWGRVSRKDYSDGAYSIITYDETGDPTETYYPAPELLNAEVNLSDDLEQILDLYDQQQLVTAQIKEAGATLVPGMSALDIPLLS